MKKTIVVFTIFSLFSQTLFAAPIIVPFGKETQGIGGTAEYVYRNEPEEVLMPVFLMGSVARAGLYHIPPKTDLITLLTLAGGPTNDALLSETLIKHQSNKVTEIDIQRLLKKPDLRSPSLANNDVIYIAAKEPVISNNTILVIGVIASIVGIIVGTVAISNGLKK